MSLAVNDMEKIVREVLFRNMELSNRISELEQENAGLRKQLRQFERPEKDSHNSSILFVSGG